MFDISIAFFHGKVRKTIYVVPPKDLRKKGKIWSLHGTRDASHVFATCVEEGLSNHGFQRNAVGPCLYWSAVLEGTRSTLGETTSSSVFQTTWQTILTKWCVKCLK